MLKVHTANIKTADQTALTSTLLAFRTRDSSAQRSSSEADLSLEFTVAAALQVCRTYVRNPADCPEAAMLKVWRVSYFEGAARDAGVKS
jgi:hypothetical protein